MTLANYQTGFQAYQSTMTSGSAVGGTLVTCDSTAHVKTATAVELIASTSFDAYKIGISVQNTFTAATLETTLVDIMRGGSGSEVVLIPDLLAGNAESNVAPRTYWFPLFIAAGTRLSAKAQSVIGSNTVEVLIHLLGAPMGPPPRTGGEVTAYNINTATSSVTNVITGISAGSDGLWGVLSAATSKDHWAWEIGIQLNAGDVAVGDLNLTMDIGTGAAAAEVIMVENLFVASSSNEAIFGPVPSLSEFYRPVPSGTRVAARAQSSAATTSMFDAALYGVT